MSAAKGRRARKKVSRSSMRCVAVDCGDFPGVSIVEAPSTRAAISVAEFTTRIRSRPLWLSPRITFLGNGAMKEQGSPRQLKMCGVASPPSRKHDVSICVDFSQDIPGVRQVVVGHQTGGLSMSATTRRREVKMRHGTGWQSLSGIRHSANSTFDTELGGELRDHRIAGTV